MQLLLTVQACCKRPANRFLYYKECDQILIFINNHFPYL